MNKINILICLYITYMIQGIQTIIFSQGLTFFTQEWSFNETDIYNIMAFTGIGKFVVILFSGILSDYIGRIKVFLFSILGFITFFIGLLFIKNLSLLYIISFIGGASSSFLDGSAYPFIVDKFKGRSSFYTVLIKISISLGTILYPLFINFLVNFGISFKFAIILPFIIMIIILLNFIFTLNSENFSCKNKSYKLNRINIDYNYLLITFVFVLYSFLCMLSFTLWIQSIPRYLSFVYGASDIEGRIMVTWYSIFSMLSCVFTAFLTKTKIGDYFILIIYFLFLTIIGIFLIFNSSLQMVHIFNISIGFFASGGVLQIGSVLYSRLFSLKKGLNTCIYNGSFSLAVIFSPLIISYLYSIGQFNNLPFFITLISCITFIVTIVIFYIYNKFEKLLINNV